MKIMHVTLAGVLLVGGCANNQQTGALFGAVAGAGVGKALGGNGRRGTNGAIVGALVGGVIGGSIGAQIDARNRERAFAARMAVLNAPAPPRLYRGPLPASYPVANANSRQPAASSYQPTQPGSPTTTREAVAAQGGGGMVPVSVPSSNWSGYENQRGGTTLIDVTAPTETSGECRTIRNAAVIRGKQVSDTERVCQDPDGSWPT